MKCQECEEIRFKKLYDDPRSPPIDIKPCLCIDCLKAAAESEIDEARRRIMELEDIVRKAK